MISHLAQDTPPDIQELPQQRVELKGGSTATPSGESQTRPVQFLNLRRLGAGIIGDVRARAPWYLCDWTDAWNYRVVPATTLTFFSK
jgi:boron transporter